MNESLHTDRVSDTTWPGDDRGQIPQASMPPGSENSPPAAVGLLKNAVQGAHHTIDRLAGSAEPAVRQLGESVSAAGDTLHAKTDEWRDTRDELIAGVRYKVRSNPLASLAVALALGALIARVMR